MRSGSLLLLVAAAGCLRGGFEGPPYHSAADGSHDGSAPDNPVPATWVALPAGTFSMGADPNEPCSLGYEDRHSVTLTNAFSMQATEVTQGDFERLMGYNPASFPTCGPSCPVETVSWHEAAAYCDALSSIAGLPGCYTCAGDGADVSCQQAADSTGALFYRCPGYRLPTDAEWEYAYRASTRTPYYNGLNDAGACGSCTELDANADQIAWYCANSWETPHPVGQKQPNGWNLHDLGGNVREHVNDLMIPDLGTAAQIDPWGAASGTGHVMRGASFVDPPTLVRAAYRISREADDRSALYGFRCVRTLLP